MLSVDDAMDVRININFILEIIPFSFPVMAAAPSDAMLIKLVNGIFLLIIHCITSLNISSPVVVSGTLLLNDFFPLISSSRMNHT